MQGINGCLCFHTHAHMWMQNIHLDLKQERLFLAGKFANRIWKHPFPLLTHWQHWNILKLSIRQSCWKKWNYLGSKMCILRCKSLVPWQTQHCRPSYAFYIASTSCYHKTYCTRKTLLCLLSMKYQELARSVIQQKHLFKASCFSPHFKGLGYAVGFVQMA